MLSPLLAGLLGAISPRAPANADLIVYAPRLDQLGGVVAFFEAAGKRAPILRPSSWRSDFDPILDLDIARLESLARSGVDTASWATMSARGDDRITCATLREPKKFEAEAAGKLKSMGQPWTSRARGAALRGAAVGGSVVAGYALLGRSTCAVSSARNGAALLKKAAEVLEAAPQDPRWKGLDSIPGRAYVMLRHFTVGLTGSSTKLSMEGRATGIGAPRFEQGRATPYAAASPGSLLFLRAHLEAASVEPSVSSVLPDGVTLCSGCSERELQDAITAVARSLTGNVVMAVDRAQLGSSLKTPVARYFAVKHAYAAEVSRPEEIRKMLERAGAWRNARKTTDGIALSIDGGEIQIGLQGSHLFIGNDTAAVKRALRAVAASPTKLEHGAEISADPRQISRALSQISLLDALGSRELAPLMAISAEVGPLLDASRPVTGWLDTAPDGALRFALTWALVP
jgi:hypothetical protein